MANIGKRVKSICNQCHIDFNALITSKGKFCSHRCYLNWQKTHPNKGAYKKGHPPTKSVYKKGETSGSNNINWKGDNVGKIAVHSWIVRRLGKPNKCEFCGKLGNRLEWANKSGLYKRDLSDWIRLCYSCHHQYDDIYTKGWITRRNKQLLQIYI